MDALAMTPDTGSEPRTEAAFGITRNEELLQMFRAGYEAARAEVIAEIRAGVEGLVERLEYAFDQRPISEGVATAIWFTLEDARAVLALLPPTEPK